MIGYIDDYLCKWASAYGGGIDIGIRITSINHTPGIVHDDQIVEAIEKCVLSMSETNQALVKHRYLGRKPDKLVALALGCSERTYRIKLDCVHSFVDGWLHNYQT